MAVAVPAGFALGTLIVAFLNLPDIFRPQKVYFVGALGASLSTISLLLLEPIGAVIASQFALGSGLPHLIRSLFADSWKPTVVGASLATLGDDEAATASRKQPGCPQATARAASPLI